MKIYAQKLSNNAFLIEEKGKQKKMRTYFQFKIITISLIRYIILKRKKGRQDILITFRYFKSNNHWFCFRLTWF